MITELATGVRRGDRRALARALTVVESGGEMGARLVDALWRDGGRALRVGVTGPPGVGKSTLVDALAREFLDAGSAVAVIAVDPSSPFTSGALLGDRIRMSRSGMDERMYIRSMANRGRLGGLAPATMDACDVLDAAGFDVVVVETVGVGQSEIDVADACDVTVVVLAPGAGDGIQALKSGLIEVADVLVVNKTDRPEAARLLADLEVAYDVSEERRRPPIVSISAASGDGVPGLRDAIIEVSRANRDRTQRCTERRLLALMVERAASAATKRLQNHREVVQAVSTRAMTPLEAIRCLEGGD